MLTCAYCGRGSTPDEITLAWSFAVEDGRRVAFCPNCSRENLRLMEGKLDSALW